MQKNDELAILRAKLSNGRQHELAFKALETIAKPVSEITQKINNSLNDESKELRIRETSRALKWLADNELAISPNYAPKQGIKGIVYRLTPKGKELKKFIYSLN